jgi:predicted dehydrogenase
MKQDVIRWGILGTGQIARQFAEALGYLDDAELTAVGSRSIENAKRFVDQYPAKRFYGSFEELVADPDLDVVYIATPHHVHRDHSILALNAGKPILCEKPFAVNARQAQEVIDLAREKNLFCMEAMWMRFLPAMQDAVNQVISGVIGKPAQLRADFGTPFRFYPKGRQFDPALAGGALLDLGIYPISLAIQLFGPAVETLSVVTMGDTGVDEASTIVMKHGGGEVSTIQSSIRHSLPTEAVITGSSGTVKIHSPLYRPHKVTTEKFSFVDGETSNPASPSKLRTLVKNTPPLQKLMLRLEAILSPLQGALRTKVIPFIGNGYNYEAAAVHQCLRSNKLECHTMPLENTLMILRTMDSIRAQWGLNYPDE